MLSMDTCWLYYIFVLFVYLTNKFFFFFYGSWSGLGHFHRLKATHIHSVTFWVFCDVDWMTSLRKITRSGNSLCSAEQTFVTTLVNAICRHFILTTSVARSQWQRVTWHLPANSKCCWHDELSTDPLTNSFLVQHNTESIVD